MCGGPTYSTLPAQTKIHLMEPVYSTHPPNASMKEAKSFYGLKVYDPSNSEGTAKKFKLQPEYKIWAAQY